MGLSCFLDNWCSVHESFFSDSWCSVQCSVLFVFFPDNLSSVHESFLFFSDNWCSEYGVFFVFFQTIGVQYMGLTCFFFRQLVLSM